MPGVGACSSSHSSSGTWGSSPTRAAGPCPTHPASLLWCKAFQSLPWMGFVAVEPQSWGSRNFLLLVKNRTQIKTSKLGSSPQWLPTALHFLLSCPGQSRLLWSSQTSVQWAAFEKSPWHQGKGRGVLLLCSALVTPALPPAWEPPSTRKMWSSWKKSGRPQRCSKGWGFSACRKKRLWGNLRAPFSA